MEHQSREQKQVVLTQEDIRGIKKDVTEMKDKLDLVHDALIGNPIAGDGGLVKRIATAEAQLAKMTDIAKSNKIYLHMVWACGGAFLMDIIYLISKK
jgi:hypothetical protein